MQGFEKVTTLVFDLDDTLRYNDPHAHGFFCDFAESLTAPLDLEQRRASQRWEHMYWATSNDLVEDLKTFGEGGENFWLNYSRRHLLSLGLDANKAEELTPLAHAHMQEKYKPASKVSPETISALQTLRRAGYHIGLLTNRPQPAHAEMHAIGLDTYLDFFLTASQLGAYKPSREIFDRLLDFLGLTNEQIAYVGDNYYADVLGARNAGVLPVLLNGNDLYSNVDCIEIKTIPSLVSLLQPDLVPSQIQDVAP